MTRREFDMLAEKYSAGECTGEEAALVEKWAALHYRHHNENPFFKTAEERLENENRIWYNVKRELDIGAKAKVYPLFRKLRPLIAASVVTAMLAGWYFVYGRFPGELQASLPPGIESRNTTVSRQRIVLPDSSMVILEPGASIVAGENYGEGTRTVYLTGEAFFEVRRDPQLPFFVYAGELVTEVLGTSFRIRPEEKRGTIEVSVMTGKVSIYTGNDRYEKKRNGVIATSNQKIVFDTESKTIRQDLVDIPGMIVPRPAETSFQFDDTPVEEVLELLQKVYGIEIVTGNAALKRCVFTGDLNELGLYEQLDYICDALRVSYEIRGAGIFISGAGCG